MVRKLSLKTIQSQIRKLQAKAEKIQMAEKPGIAELRSLLARYKLSPADIKTAMKGKRGTSRGIARGSKLQPKYRNPTNKDETWAGRGLKPKWLSALLKKGKKLEDFAL